MKNITVSIDDETYRRARMKAAENDTSVSAVVKRLLTEFADGKSTFDQLLAEEAALRASIRSFDASDRLSRDELHERGV
jgi:hypothetical protein